MEVNNNNNKDNKMQNITNSTQYDDYLKSHVQSYVVTKSLGLGKYQKTPFSTLAEAISYKKLINSKQVNSRVIVYGLSKPPHTDLTITIAMGV